MKNALKIMVVMFALAMLVGGAFAQEAPKADADAVLAMGQVTAVSAESITVKANDAEATFALTADVKFAKAGEGDKTEAATAADVVVGAVVKIMGKDKVVTTVVVMPAAK